mgnify:CR=1 FL=1
MELTVDEFIDLQNRMSEGLAKAVRKGRELESQKPMPNNLFDALVEYGKKTETLIDYEKGNDSNWVQLKPTREGSEGVKYVEISFEDNACEVHHIGTHKDCDV